MDSGSLERLLVILSLLNSIACDQDITRKNDAGFKKNEEMCRKFANEPFFEPDIIVGSPWRIYYSWHWKLEKKCMDMRFKHATSPIVDRFYNDMYEYLALQPNWDQAALYLTMGKASHEMLLFADQKTVGRLQGVSNVLRDSDIIPSKQGVPLLEFQMKLIRGGKFLLMMDCKIGVVTLAARFGESPYRTEIDAAVTELGLGEGSPACVSDRNPDENYVLPEAPKKRH